MSLQQFDNWFCNCSRYWILHLLACLPSSMTWQDGRRCLVGSSRQEGSLVLSVAPPPPKVLWSSLHVMTTTKRWKVSYSKMTLGVFFPHLMCSGNAVHIVATWHILTSGVNAPLVCLLGFSLSSSLSFFFAITVPCFFFSGLFSLRYLHFSFLGLLFWGTTYFHLLYSL